MCWNLGNLGYGGGVGSGGSGGLGGLGGPGGPGAFGGPGTEYIGGSPIRPQNGMYQGVQGSFDTFNLNKLIKMFFSKVY